MTTAAFDGKQFAVDSQWTHGDTPIYRSKLRRITFRGERAVAAGAGLVEHWTPVIEWIASECKGEPPEIAEKNNFSILIVTKSRGVFYMDESLFVFELGQTRWAIGTGSDYALGAMAAGKTAAEAVEVASALDINTGGNIDSVMVARL